MFNHSKLLMLILSAALIFAGASCKKEPIAPPPASIDSTSHDFVVVRIDTLGGWFSTARCVDIVNENSIWVGGQFMEKDSAGDKIFKYNLAHWDGKKWKMIEVNVQGEGWPADPMIQPLANIKAFNDIDIFVISPFNAFARWNGQVWYTRLPEQGVWEHLWGRTINDIYFVGNSARATHWDGSTFTKMPTGISNPPFCDIWGDENRLYAVGRPDDPSMTGNETIFAYSQGLSWTITNEYDVFDKNPPPPNQYVGGMISVFRKDAQSNLWLLGGQKLFRVVSLAPFKAEEFYEFPFDYYPLRVRGNADNDLFLGSGINADLIHYNGNTWKQIRSGRNNLVTQDFCVHGDVAVAACISNVIDRQGIVVIYKRASQRKEK